MAELKWLYYTAGGASWFSLRESGGESIEADEYTTDESTSTTAYKNFSKQVTGPNYSPYDTAGDVPAWFWVFVGEATDPEGYIQLPDEFENRALIKVVGKTGEELVFSSEEYEETESHYYDSFGRVSVWVDTSNIEVQSKTGYDFLDNQDGTVTIKWSAEVTEHTINSSGYLVVNFNPIYDAAENHGYLHYYNNKVYVGIPVEATNSAFGGQVPATLKVYSGDNKLAKDIDYVIENLSDYDSVIIINVDKIINKSVTITYPTYEVVDYDDNYEDWVYIDDSATSLSQYLLTGLPASKSKTGTAFYQPTWAKCFPIPDTKEIWIKFDVYFNGSQRWRAYNDGSKGTIGITAQTNGGLSFFANDVNVSPNNISIAGICKKNQLQTVLLHMTSDNSNGVIEAWVDEEKIYTYTGDVNHGEDFADVYLQSDGSSTFFSNVTIANYEIGFGDGWHENSFDLERKILKQVEFTVDVQRQFVQPLIVPAIGEHFNHLVGSITLLNGGIKKILLPKRSNVYIRGSGCGIIKVCSEIDRTGKITGDSFFTNGEMYARLDECQIFSIEMNSSITPQLVIQAFMKSLSETNSNESTSIDEAINYATGGKFVSRTDLVNRFIADLDNSPSYTDFLADFCDIILGNADTGAITGSDAGGDKTKTAKSVVPEEIVVTNWEVPTAGSTTVIEGLTVHFPTKGANGTFTDAEKHILAGLNSEWIKQSLLLIKKSLALSFNENSYVRDLTIKFENTELTSQLANISYTTLSGKATSLTLTVNMHYYNDIDTTSEDGKLITSSPRYDSAGYLDRTLAHELTHAVMAANIYRFDYLPLLIKEGAAELVHGIDDLRGGAIVDLLTTDKSTLEQILQGTLNQSGENSYVAGYLFFRYLAKQGQNQNVTYIPNEIEISNLLISDGATNSDYEALTDNTRQILFADILRTLMLSSNFYFDVEIFSVIPVEFLVDLKRSLLATLILFPRESEDFFADENNPYVVRSRKSPVRKSPQLRTTPLPNTPGLQSFEVSLAEQQITDQVRFSTAIPFDIMQQVKGQYLDYKYDMRVERVQQTGIWYSCDCCSDIDQLLFTQIAYKIPWPEPFHKIGDETWEKLKTAAETVKKYLRERGTLASDHVRQIANALGLSPVMQFDDYFSTVLMDDQGGVTYNDLIRDIFGWSARIPTQLINVFIREGKLFVIERGHESHTVDISSAQMTVPTITKELVRTVWGSTPWSKTITHEIKTFDSSALQGISIFEPPTYEIPTPEPSLPPSVKPDGDDDDDDDDDDEPEGSDFEYNDDGLIEKDVTIHEGEDGKTKVETTYKYEDLENGRKFLAKEIATKYEWDAAHGWVFVERTLTEHTPLEQGQTKHVRKSDDGDIRGGTISPNSTNEAVVPPAVSTYVNGNNANSNKKWRNYFADLNERIESASSNEGFAYDEQTRLESLRAYKDWLNNVWWPAVNSTWVDETYTMTFYGLSLVDTSFPISQKGSMEKLQQVTDALRNLNRKTKETVNVTLYNFEHLIDFNDKVILNGATYFLASNTTTTNQRIKFEQKLSLVRWY